MIAPVRVFEGMAILDPAKGLTRDVAMKLLEDSARRKGVVITVIREVATSEGVMLEIVGHG